jgi:pyruvate dehydrogenase complex dehydrogenase (E1) component
MPALPSDPDEAERVRLGTIKGLYRFADYAGPADAPADASAGDGSGADVAAGADGTDDPGNSHKTKKSKKVGRKARKEQHAEADVDRARPRATVLFSGSAWRAAIDARRQLADRWGVDVDAWSVTSYKSLREDALSCERWNRLHPGHDERVPFVTGSLAGSEGPIVAITDFMRTVPDQVARWMPRRFLSLGTDGFGRSDTREVLRRFFEVDAAHVVVAVLHALAAEGLVPDSRVDEAIGEYGIDPGAPDPWSV